MKIGELICGFRVTNAREVEGITGTFYEMVYEKTGTELCFFDRPDNNKTFAVSFKTVPEDDTGVFHILEHSVLCGSEKYPLKEPFVELLKGSMQTFLNAFTFPDKTMYPVCSRNETDFCNLISVYMDAVLHPAILENPNIFRQEGWHYEIDGEGKLSTSGVVLNEMRGAYSSPDGVIEEELTKLLYPDVCYGKDSGGEPTAITSLTYEEFCAAHARFYHPSGAKIFLDGEMDIARVLGVLDAFLSPYGVGAKIPDIPEQTPVCRQKSGTYEIGKDEDPAGKIRLAYGYIGFPYDNKEDRLGMAVMHQVLAGTNDAPLKKALLEEGMCEDLAFYSYDGIRQSAEIITVQNTDEDKIEAIEKIIRRVLTDAANGNIKEEKLIGALNSMEFSLREGDYGTQPKGLAYAMTSMESWLYGGDPTQNLSYDSVLRSLREKIGTPYYADLVRRVLLDNPHTAKLIMHPSRTLGAEREAAEAERMKEKLDAMSAEEVEKVKSDLEALRSWQQSSDTPEALASLPHLSLSDISNAPEKTEVKEGECDGVKVIEPQVEVSGIFYTRLSFNIADLEKEDLHLLGILSVLLGDLGTEKYTSEELQTEIDTHIGSISFAPTFTQQGDEYDAAKAYMCAGLAALRTEAKPALALLAEILKNTRFDDKKKIRQVLAQLKLAQENAFPASGHSIAMDRVSARLTTEGVLSEYVGGLSSYRYVCGLIKDFDKKSDRLCADLSALCKRIFTKDRLFVSIYGDHDEELTRLCTDICPADGVRVAEKSSLAPLGAAREGIVIPAQVSFAVSGGRLGGLYGGHLSVARNVISLEYLWNRVRVQGGAYGAGMSLRRSRIGFYYSYRDPSAQNSLGVYNGCPDFLRSFASGADTDLEKYIIGAISASEPILSPRVRAIVATTNYLRGVSYADVCRERECMLSTTAQDLTRIADGIEKVYDGACICVIGSRAKVEAAKAAGFIDTVTVL